MTTPSSLPATNPLPNLGPGALAATEPDDFLISKSELYTLQTYIETALQQPTTEDDVRKLIARATGIPTPTDEQLKAIKLPENIGKVLQTLAAISRHCRIWKTKTFPEIVALAGDIAQYNLSVPTYYGEILKLVPALRKQDRAARETLHDLIDDLAAEAQTRAEKAAAAAAKAAEFHAETVADGAAIHAHVTEFEETIGDSGATARKLRAQLAEQKKIHEEAIAEYNQVVVVAATSPTYAWTCIFPPLGPIPIIIAAVIAGVYGDRAVKAKNRADGAVAMMKTLARQLDENSQLVEAMHATGQNVLLVESKLQAAIPVIKRIQQSWEGINQELLGIKALLTENMAEALPTQLGALVNKAISEWREVAKLADRYRVSAFIDIAAPGPVASA